MAYQIGRAKRVRETLELVDECGNVVKRLPVDLDADSIAMEFNRKYNAVMTAESAIKSMTIPQEGSPIAMTQEDADNANQAIEAFGNAVIELFGMIFGESGTQELLDFYDGKYFEMSLEVVPFIVDVVVPAIKKSTEDKRSQLAKNYKVSQSASFGLNRFNRRRMGL